MPGPFLELVVVVFVIKWWRAVSTVRVAEFVQNNRNSHLHEFPVYEPCVVSHRGYPVLTLWTRSVYSKTAFSRIGESILVLR